MPKVKATKPKIKPPIEISDDEFSSTSSSTSSTYSLLLSSLQDKDIEEEVVDKPSPAYIKKNQGKRNYSLSSPKEDSQNLKRNLAKIKSTIASLYFPPLSLK